MKNLLLTTLLLTSFSAFADDSQSCLKSIGKKDSETLVKWCVNVSPATHPPCNNLNSCSLIADEIRRGCSFLIKDNFKPMPFYCMITTDSNPH